MSQCICFVLFFLFLFFETVIIDFAHLSMWCVREELCIFLLMFGERFLMSGHYSSSIIGSNWG